MARRNSPLNNWFTPLAAGAVITTSMFVTLNMMNDPATKITTSNVEASCVKCFWQGQKCAGNTVVECRDNCFSVVSNCDKQVCKATELTARCTNK